MMDHVELVLLMNILLKDHVHVQHVQLEHHQMAQIVFYVLLEHFLLMDLLVNLVLLEK